MTLEALATPSFWSAAAQIVLIDLLLGGDNAVIIALASRNLPSHQRRRAIVWGTTGAVVLRIVLTLFALSLLGLPGLKLTGALLLLWIGMRLMLPSDGHEDVEAADDLWIAVRTVIVADLIMSLDNVVAIAAAARNAAVNAEWALVAFGLALSVPIVVWGSTLVIRLINRFPVVVDLGAMLLGWIAGELCVGDPLLKGWLDASQWGELLRHVAGVSGVILVWLGGQWMRARHRGAAR